AILHGARRDARSDPPGRVGHRAQRQQKAPGGDFAVRHRGAPGERMSAEPGGGVRGAVSIVIRCGGVFLTAELDDCDTARKVAAALPITSEAGRWGDEVYFEIPVAARLAADARDVMQPGEIAYWPPGRAFCIFWGRTPSSRGTEIRAASAVNPIGRVTGA